MENNDLKKELGVEIKLFVITGVRLTDDSEQKLQDAILEKKQNDNN